MEAIILVIHLMVAIVLVIVVLVQPSEAGGFLGSSGSMSNLMAPRRKGDALTRVTTILAAIFFLTSLSLAIIAEHRAPAKSILDVPVETTAPKAAPAPAAPASVAPADEKTAPDASALKTVAPAKPAAPETKKKKPTAPISK
jgi:preprotein translocase subunit SecG